MENIILVGSNAVFPCTTILQDEADIFLVLFIIGRKHGSYAASTVEETSQDVSSIKHYCNNQCVIFKTSEEAIFFSCKYKSLATVVEP